jgi:hypothetical protein
MFLSWLMRDLEAELPEKLGRPDEADVHTHREAGRHY